MSNDDESRALFEQWATNAIGAVSLTRGEPDFPDIYMRFEVQFAWDAWQAARIAAPPEPSMQDKGTEATLSGQPSPMPESGRALTQAERDVLAERRRHIEHLGWTAEHDDEHGGADLASAAGSYALYGGSHRRRGEPPATWPWESASWKPKDFREDCVRAAALLLAAIECSDRAEDAIAIEEQRRAANGTAPKQALSASPDQHGATGQS